MTEDLTILPDKRWYPIETRRLLLRPFTLDDANAIQAYAGDSEVAKYMAWGPNTENDTQAVLRKWLEDYDIWPNHSVELGVQLKESGEIIGGTRLSIESHSVGDIGYCISSQHWCKGYATESAGALVEVAFRTLNLHRLYATCDKDNISSWRVMEKIGMRREGTFRADKFIKGRWRDSYLYAMLISDWQCNNVPQQ